MSMFRMSNWGSLLSSPFLQLPLGFASMGEQDRLQSQYNRDTDQQRADMLRVAGQIGPEQLAAYDQGAGQQNALMRDMLTMGRARAGGLINETDRLGADRYNWAAGNLEGYGNQQRQDLNRSFDEALASNLAGMQERGIASTTAVGSQRNLNREMLGGEQRRLGEDLTRMRQDILGGIQGQNMAARLGALQNFAGIEQQGMGNMANFYGQNAATRANLIGSGYGTMLNTLGSFNYMPPNQNPYPGIIGQNLVDPPDATKANSSAAPWIQTAGQVAGAVLPFLFMSDRELKDIVDDTDNEAILETVKSLPTYEYKWKPETGMDHGRHVGPMAQDFWAAFRLGDHDTTINAADAIGVLFAAVKALIWRIEELEAA